jgi:hypothetical protein
LTPAPARRYQCLNQPCAACPWPGEALILNAANVILALKIAVSAVTVLLLVSLLALWRGQYRLHGRLNTAFFLLTLAAVLGLEVIIRLIDPDLFKDDQLRQALGVHLCFSVPALVLMFAMFITGRLHRRAIHLTLAVLFGVAWVGTFITGIFFLQVPS